MAAKVVIQDTVLVNSSGISVGANATVTIRDAASGGLISLWEDRAGATGESNPFSADSEGHFTVYANPGRVQISVDDGAGNTIVWQNVPLLDMDADSDGAALNIDEIVEGAGAAGTGFADGIRADSILEHTAANGVDVDGVLIKDGQATQAATAALLMPRGYISGFLPSHAADTDHDMTVGAGQCLDTAGTRNCILASALTKQIDADWAAGDAAGGLFTHGSAPVASDTSYHAWLIEQDASPGTFDWGWDTSAAGANAPAGWTARRRLFSILTDGSANIINASWTEIAGGGLRSDYLAMVRDLDTHNANTTRNTLALTVPSGLELEASVNLFIQDAGNSGSAWVQDVSYTDAAPDDANSDISISTGTTGERGRIAKSVMTDISGQVAHRQNSTSLWLSILTSGFRDHRRV